LLHRRQAQRAAGQDDVGHQRDQFRRVCALAVDVVCAPSNVDARVAADRPSRFLQPLEECRKAGLPFRVVCSPIHEHANAPHPLSLLRARCERPRCDAADRSYKFASFDRDRHRPPPCAVAKRIERYHAAHLSSCRLGAECGACAVAIARACRHERAMHHGIRGTSAESEPAFWGLGRGLRPASRGHGLICAIMSDGKNFLKPRFHPGVKPEHLQRMHTEGDLLALARFCL
jgi:hypothetical protein